MSRFNTFLFGCGALFLFLCLTSAAPKSNDTTHPLQRANTKLLHQVIVTKTSATSVRLDWDTWLGAGAYTVRVRAVDTGNLIQSFDTFASTCNVQGLEIGSTYQFEVEKAGYIIIEGASF